MENTEHTQNNWILTAKASEQEFAKFAGGKARNMRKMTVEGFRVPEWFCVSSRAYDAFVAENGLADFLRVRDDFKSFSEEVEKKFLACPLPAGLESEIRRHLEQMGLLERFVAVRSSGLDEDSAENSFAGQFSSYLFQRGMPAISMSLKRCWASAYSERALSYRKERRLSLEGEGISVGVVIQKMVNARAAGVSFSRDPIKPLDRDRLLISSVWGLGEGLVSGELDADHFAVKRSDLSIIESHIVEKEHELLQAAEGGLRKSDVEASRIKMSSLQSGEISDVATLTLGLEKKLGAPQDCEWAIEEGKVYLVQTRPITTLPGDAFFDPKVNGADVILWDNSNIIESYSGVTSPLTFSFANFAYRQVYIQFCEVMGVPPALIVSHEAMYRNMLGLIRGRIYYNLINWYRLVLMLPGTGNNKAFMETMMGVRQQLKPELASLFEFTRTPPKYSSSRRLWILGMTLWRFIRMDQIVSSFQSHFKSIYESTRKIDFRSQSLVELSRIYQRLEEQILRKWQAPIINDYLCMVFFGLLKKLTEKWLAAASPEPGADLSSLQNDLLCGQGDLESTEPTKMLMRIAEMIDRGDPKFREWFLSVNPREAWVELNQKGRSQEVCDKFLEFLDRYGFRCVNELKLEEPDLHDDPSFVVNAVASYVKMKSYSIASMEVREREIRDQAEALVRSKLSGGQRVFYFWVVKQTRRAVKNRENLRFARTKIFGVVRHIFRAMGGHLVALRAIPSERDVFYLTVEELLAYIEGRALSSDLGSLIRQRQIEFEEYKATPSPPDRLFTYGAAGASQGYPQVLADADLLASEKPVSDDPNVLIGTPCCPGVVEGEVRVVHDLKDAEGLSGQILVTGRTDPGWVPLYPSCAGLLIERGSLLSHSAVVARELGLPTIVGISGGLMQKLKTGMRVRIDAARGEVRIL